MGYHLVPRQYPKIAWIEKNMHVYSLKLWESYGKNFSFFDPDPSEMNVPEMLVVPPYLALPHEY